MIKIISLICLFLLAGILPVCAQPPAPPAGMHWVQTFGDEFNGTSIDTTKWNGSYFGTEWGCTEPNYVAPGPGGCSNNYYGVTEGSGVLSLTGTPNAASGFQNTTTRAAVNTSTTFVQRYGYFEFSAKMPHDTNHEGDGMWPGLWFLPLHRLQEATLSGCGSGAEEPDLVENIESTLNLNTVHWSIHDQCTDNSEFSNSYPITSAGDLSAAFNTYGLYWKKDGSAHGTMCAEFNGIEQQCHTLTNPDPASTTQPSWDNGIYTLMQEVPCPPNNSPFWNGAPCTNNTSSNDPLLIDYYRVYQLVPNSANSFTALIGGSVVNSSYVIDGGFWSSFWGFPPDARVYQNNQPNTSQQYNFAPVTGGFTICDVANSSCLTDGSDSLVNQGQGTDTWIPTQSGSQWILQNVRTGRYIGTLPTTQQANIQMSTAPVAIPLTLISGSFPSGGASQDCTTITTVGPAITDASNNTWSLTAGGNVAENGVTDTSTFNVIELVYSAGFIYQENTSGNWYRRTATTSWNQVAAPACATPTPTPTPSPTPTPTPGTLGFTSSSNPTLTGTVNIIISMSSQATSSKMYLDGTWVAVIPPTTWVWDTTKVSNGSHTIRQDEFNSNGSLINSESMTVTVGN
jgi:hypothetical protein